MSKACSTSARKPKASVSSEPCLVCHSTDHDVTALITISTRASLKRYHSFTLTLGLGDSGEEWEFQRIGTQAEKSSVEKELKELRERLANVDQWTKRRQAIDDELNKVWVEGSGEELAPPAYGQNESAAEGDIRETSHSGSMSDSGALVEQPQEAQSMAEVASEAAEEVGDQDQQ